MKWYSKNRIYLRRIYIFLIAFGIDFRKTFYFIKNFLKFINDLFTFKKKGGKINNIYPFFDNYNSDAKEFENQLFHADLLISQYIYQKKPLNHLDIGSRIDGLVAHVASYRKLDVMDIRNVNIKPHKNINFIKKDLIKIQNFDKEKKYDSISSIGVIGHIGLGRYGDEIDPNGHVKAIKNICNLTIESGLIYILVPVGKKGVEFNSHRVLDPKEIINYFKENNCELLEFNLVNDFGNLETNCDINNSENLNFGGGIFIFKKL